MATLRELHIFYEDETKLIERLRPLGLSEPAARQLGAYYLSQAREFGGLIPSLRDGFAAAGTEIFYREIGELDDYLLFVLNGPSADSMTWNLTDGFRFYRGSYVNSIAALRGAPYFGSPAQAQQLAQDKFKSLAVVAALGIDCPAMRLYRAETQLAGAASIPRRKGYFVKPNSLGAKLGIREDALCRDWRQAKSLAARIWDLYRDEALVQAFIPGTDVRVCFLDLDGGLDVDAQLGIYGIVREPGASDAAEDLPFATMDEAGRSRRRYVDLQAAAEDDTEVAKVVTTIRAAVERIVTCFGLKDYFACDFRVAPDGKVYFLEFEVSPGITALDFLVYLDKTLGVDLATGLKRAILASHRRQTG